MKGDAQMFPLGLSGLVSGGMSLLGGLMQQNTQENMLQQQEQFSAQQAQQQEQFQEQMSNTAYTRAVADMKNAGLNPILAAGSPESSPSGAMGSTPSAPQIQNVLGQSANAAMAAQQQQAQTEKLTADTDAVESNIDNVDADTALKHKQFRTEVNRGDLVAAQTGVQTGLLKSMQADIAKSENLADFFRSDTGRILVRAGVAGDMVNSALSPAFSTVSSVMGARTAASAAALNRMKTTQIGDQMGLSP